LVLTATAFRRLRCHLPDYVEPPPGVPGGGLTSATALSVAVRMPSTTQGDTVTFTLVVPATHGTCHLQVAVTTRVMIFGLPVVFTGAV